MESGQGHHSPISMMAVQPIPGCSHPNRAHAISNGRIAGAMISAPAEDSGKERIVLEQNNDYSGSGMAWNEQSVESARRKYENLTFSDSYMFSAVLTRNRKLCKRILETILERKVVFLRYVNSEQSLKEAPDARGVRLDVYLEDNEGKLYNVEMQAYDEPDIAARSRYYQANMDIAGLRNGTKDYKELPEAWVIFICRKDYFGHNLCRYSYENRCIETGDALNDRAKRIFLNASGEDPSISKELREFLNYIKDKKPRGKLTRQIEAQVKKNRKDRRLLMDFIPYEIEMERAREEGEKRGEKRGIKLGEKRGIKKGIEKLAEHYRREDPKLTMKEAREMAEKILK